MSEEEKIQILYNHIKLGNQTTTWKQQAKPYLESVAKTENFLPGIAERLGNSIFTKKIPLAESALVRFMAEPEEHLIETIKELEPPLRAALILVFANQGHLPLTADNPEVVEAVEKATGVKAAYIADALAPLENSFLRKTIGNDDEEAWVFEHPTIADALTKMLDKQPLMLAFLLRGAKVQKILADFVCYGTKKVRDTMTVPKEQEFVLADRLRSVPDEIFVNSALFSFLAERANNEVFRQVIGNEPAILDRTTWHRGDVWLDPKFRVHARAASLSILPDASRHETAALLKEAAVSKLDLTFLDREEFLALIPPRELFALGAQVRILIEEKLADIIQELSTDADLDHDAESNFETISHGLQLFEEIVGVNADEDSICANAHSVIRQEIQAIEEQQEERRREIEKAEWTFVQTHNASRPPRVPPTREKTGQRSTFDDVDG